MKPLDSPGEGLFGLKHHLTWALTELGRAGLRVTVRAGRFADGA
jgi:hypothetical protein